MKINLISLTLAALLTLGCQKTPKQKDDPHPRVVSFSPAMTEMIFDMGLGDHVVGVTSWAKLPEGETRRVVGNRAEVNAEAILAVQPDLIFIQQNPGDFDPVIRINPKIQVERFADDSIEDIAVNIERVGRLLGAKELGIEKSRQFRSQLESIRNSVAGLDRPRVFYIMGFNRPITAGKRSYINDLINFAGGINAASDKVGYPRIDAETVLKANPDVLICQVWDGGLEEASKEYWTGKDFADLPANKTGRVFIVTDSHWSLPSTKVVDILRKMTKMIHPQLADVENIESN